jgi:hypothetical protein
MLVSLVYIRYLSVDLSLLHDFMVCLCLEHMLCENIMLTISLYSIKKPERKPSVDGSHL